MVIHHFFQADKSNELQQPVLGYNSDPDNMQVLSPNKLCSTIKEAGMEQIDQSVNEMNAEEKSNPWDTMDFLIRTDRKQASVITIL